jgi:hypothetical protein
VYHSVQSLRKHTKTHTTPKPHTCAECGASYRKHTQLAVHRAEHTGTLPFLCETEGCGTSFQTPSALRKHQKTHRGRATDLASAIKNDILGGVTLSRDPFTVFLTEYLWQLDISDICTQFGWVHGVEPNKNSRTSKFSGHV